MDGTFVQVQRPTSLQKEVYSGYYRGHGLKFLGVMAPNGLSPFVWGPASGRRHDSAVLTESGLLAQLSALHAAYPGIPYHLFGDSAFPLTANIQVGFKGAHLTQAQKDYNFAMSAVRIAVEWGFGRTANLWKFPAGSGPGQRQIYKSASATQYLISALLTNCHACAYGNVVSSYFGVPPPSLRAYLDVANPVPLAA